MNEKTDWRKRILSSSMVTQQLVIMSVLVVLMVVLSIVSDKFFTAGNISNVVRQVATVVITGSGVTLLMIAGQMDLSVGSTVALCAVLCAKFAAGGMNMVVSMILAALVGGLIGTFNGVVVTKMKIAPVIATMGTMYIARGLAYIACDGKPVNRGIPLNFDRLGRGFIGPIPTMVFITVAIVLVFMFIQKHTVLGKYTFAIGGNKVAAELSGLNNNRIILYLYAVVGLLAGFCGVLTASRLGAGDPNIATGFEFDVICAVVLGGTSLAGGEGSVLGMVFGALIVGFLGNGLNLMGVDTFYQNILKGTVLIVAVVMSGNIQKRIRMRSARL